VSKKVEIPPTGLCSSQKSCRIMVSTKKLKEAQNEK
jgi:hypothetical protein